MPVFPGKPFFNTALVATVVDIKSGGVLTGLLYSVEGMNVDAADVFIQFFNLDAADVTLGTTVPNLVVHVPPGDATLFGTAVREWANGVVFDVGLSWAATTTPTGNSAGSTALDVSVTVS